MNISSGHAIRTASFIRSGAFSIQTGGDVVGQRRALLRRKKQRNLPNESRLTIRRFGEGFALQHHAGLHLHLAAMPEQPAIF